MAIIRMMKCIGCGLERTEWRDNRYDHRLGYRCDDCVDACRVRLSLGEGEHADHLMALLYPVEYAQERRIEMFGKRLREQLALASSKS